MNKYTSNTSKDCVLEVDLEYPRELREVRNDFLLAPDKIEIKREMLSIYQLKIADFYNIPIGNVKRLVPNFLRKKLCIPLWKLKILLETRITASIKKRIEAVKTGDKDGKAL